MVRTCIICKEECVPSNLTGGNKSRSFHKFPNNNNLKEKWLSAIGRASVAKTARICSDHFKPGCFNPLSELTVSSRKTLLLDAIPFIATGSTETLENENAQATEETASKSNNFNVKVENCMDDTIYMVSPEESPQNSTLIDNSSENSNEKNEYSPQEAASGNSDQHFLKRKKSTMDLEMDAVPPKFPFMDTNQRKNSTLINNNSHEMNLSSPEANPVNSTLINGSSDATSKRTEHSPVETANTNSKINSLKRKKSMADIETDVIPSKFCFKDDNGRTYVMNNSDCVSQDKFRNFYICYKAKLRQVDRLRKQLKRRNTKISSLKELVNKLAANREHAVVEYLQARMKREQLAEAGHTHTDDENGDDQRLATDSHGATTTSVSGPFIRVHTTDLDPLQPPSKRDVMCPLHPPIDSSVGFDTPKEDKDHEIFIKEEPLEMETSKPIETFVLETHGWCDDIDAPTIPVKRESRASDQTESPSKPGVSKRVPEIGGEESQKGECDSFGEYVAMSLRKYDARRRMIIKQAINNIILEEEMKTSSGCE